MSNRHFVLFCVLGHALLACSGECELNDDLRLFAGEAAVDCGTADAKHERAAVDQCATDSFEAQTAFIARYDSSGEHPLVLAVAMNSAGQVKLFRYTSSCTGGACQPATDVQTCEQPSPGLVTSEEPNALPISCESLGLPQRVCS